MRSLLVIALFVFPVSAFAGEGSLVAVGGQGLIPVWRSSAAAKEGPTLLRANADATVVMPLIACTPEPGTRVVEGVDDPGLYLRSVIVIKGKLAGCRGIVAKENFRAGAQSVERETSKPGDSGRKKDARGDVYPSPPKTAPAK
jgi:hypothetical protein